MKNKDLKLRFYQKDVIQQVIKNNSSSLIQIPTGGGKTIIAKHLIEHFLTENKRVLFIVPKIILMEQTIKVLNSLDPQVIHGNKTFDKTHQIFISTIQTISRRKDITFDVIFIDEIHYGFDGKMIDSLIKQNPKARIIGLSATPYDKNGKLIHGFDFVINKYDMKYWLDWNDCLGINKDDEKLSNHQNIILFEEARNYARSLKLANELEWKNFYDKCFPFYKYPMEPKDLYLNRWISWKDWLGLE